MTDPTTLPFAADRALGVIAFDSRDQAHAELRLLRLLSTFFGECPLPAAAEWLRLVNEYRDHEDGIIDFAFRYATSGGISRRQLPDSWQASAFPDGATVGSSSS